MLLIARICHLGSSASVWGFLNTACILAAGIATIPIVSIRLSPEALGLWYTLYALTNLATLASSGGLTPTIQRFASYLQAGALDLTAHGVPDMPPGAPPNLARLARLRQSARTMLGKIGVVGILLVMVIGGGLVLHAGLAGRLRNEAWFALVLQAISIGLQVRIAGDCAIVQGIGGLAYMQRAMALARLCYAIVLIVALSCGSGLISLGLSGIAMAAIQGIAAHRYLDGQRRLPDQGKYVDAAGQKADIAAMWPTSWRFCLVGLGAWLITASGTLLSGFLLGLTEAGRYGIALQLFGACGSIAGVWIAMAIPTICVLRAQQRHDELRRYFTRRALLAVGTYVSGAITIIIVAPCLLGLIAQHAVLPTTSVLAAMAVVFMLEFHHGSIWATVLMTGNEVPFLASALISGVGVLAAGAMLVAGGMGIWGLVLGQGVVQAAYNNWYWPLRGYRSLQCGRVA